MIQSTKCGGVYHGFSARLARNEEKFSTEALVNLRNQLIGRGYTDRRTLVQTRHSPRLRGFFNKVDPLVVMLIHTTVIIYWSQQATASNKDNADCLIGLGI